MSVLGELREGRGKLICFNSEKTTHWPPPFVLLPRFSGIFGGQNCKINLQVSIPVLKFETLRTPRFVVPLSIKHNYANITTCAKDIKEKSR